MCIRDRYRNKWKSIADTHINTACEKYRRYLYQHLKSDADTIGGNLNNAGPQLMQAEGSCVRSKFQNTQAAVWKLCRPSCVQWTSISPSVELRHAYQSCQRLTRKLIKNAINKFTLWINHVNQCQYEMKSTWGCLLKSKVSPCLNNDNTWSTW